nr:hypothetical protein [uncultured Solibaculum sp.]
MYQQKYGVRPALISPTAIAQIQCRVSTIAGSLKSDYCTANLNQRF